jgi:hypothetical protein
MSLEPGFRGFGTDEAIAGKNSFQGWQEIDS